jgi:hypothetical protein
MNEPVFSVQFVASESEISPALWDACFPPPIEGRWWYQSLENSGFEDQFTFAYGVIHEGAKPVGIAPIFFMDVPLSLAVPPWFRPSVRILEKILPSVFCPRTLFVGSPGAEEGTVGLLPGVNQQLALLYLQRSLEAEARRLRASMIIWKDFPESYDHDLNWVAHEQRMFPLISFPNTIVELPTNRKEDYFVTLKSSRRNKLKRKIRLSTERVDVEIAIVKEPDKATMDRIFDLYWRTLKKADVTFEILNRRFFEVVAAKPMSYFIVMREKKTREIIAFMLYFDIEGRILNKYIGIDYNRPRDWFLYFRLWDAAVDSALSRGASSIKSGQTSYEAKIEMGHTIIPLTNYCQHRNYLFHGIYRAIAKRISWQTLDDQLAQFLKAHSDKPVAARN